MSLVALAHSWHCLIAAAQRMRRSDDRRAERWIVELTKRRLEHADSLYQHRRARRFEIIMEVLVHRRDVEQLLPKVKIEEL